MNVAAETVLVVAVNQLVKLLQIRPRALGRLATQSWRAEGSHLSGVEEERERAWNCSSEVRHQNPKPRCWVIRQSYVVRVIP